MTATTYSDPKMPAASTTTLPADWRDFFALTKPRVMSLVVFTGLCGLLAAPQAIHPVLGFTAVLCIALGAGGAGALNQWWEADLDAGMKRTAKRPLPSGRIDRTSARDFGVALSVASVLIMGLAVNWLAAALLALSLVYYAVVYTIWLKPRTPQNIVIGGGAGAFPPLIGWVAATGDITLMPVLLFAIIFVWTPPHFWALALFVKTDYAKVGIPMLPVVAGEAETRRQILIYSLVLLIVSLVPWWIGGTSWIYGGAALVLSGAFLLLSIPVALRRAGEGDRMKPEKRLFAYSVLYLFALFAALVADRALLGLGGAA
jgi:heme o synthase